MTDASQPTGLSTDLMRLSETIDHIMTTDVPGRGSSHLLYKAARRAIGQPLAMTAAKALADNVSRGDFVFFITGFLVRTQFSPEIAETDGPPGIATLARAIHRLLGGIPVIIVEDSIATRVGRVLEAAGFFMVPAEKAPEAAKPSLRPSQAAVIQTFPVETSHPAREAVRLIERFSPKAVVSVERGGPNAKGVIHSSQGLDATACHARIDLLFKTASEIDKGPLTIAVGDGGNEVGMGTIAEDLRQWLPYGRKCQCPCEGGIIPETRADILVPASVSNWGASAIAAALALLVKDAGAGPNPDLERRLIRRCADVGFIDSTGRIEEAVDSMPAEVSESIACLLEQSVICGIQILSGKRFWKTPDLEERDN
jgi:hypothetical protein